MKHISLIILVIWTGFLVGCSSSGNSDFIGRLDLSGAQSLAIASAGGVGARGISTSSAGDRTVLLKLDIDGNIEEVTHYDDNNRETRAPNPLEVRNIDDDWIALFYSEWRTLNQAGSADHAYIVQKSTGNAYSLPRYMNVKRSVDGFSQSANGQLFVRLRDTRNWDVGIHLYRIQPGTTPTATRISIAVDNVGDWYSPGHHSIPAFAVANDGTVIYNSNSTNGNWDPRTRLIFPNGSGFTLRSEQSFFWSAPDGNIYWYNDSKIVTPELNGTSINNVVYSALPEDTWINEWGTQLIRTPNRIIGVDTGSGEILELFRTDLNGTDLNKAQLTDSNSWSWNAVSDTAWIGDKIIFLVSGNLIPFNPTTFEVEDKITPSETFEFYSIQPFSDTEVLFSGLRNIDSAMITGTINVEDGSINVSTANTSFEVVQLERIN